MSIAIQNSRNSQLHHHNLIGQDGRWDAQEILWILTCSRDQDVKTLLHISFHSFHDCPAHVRIRIRRGAVCKQHRCILLHNIWFLQGGTVPTCISNQLHWKCCLCGPPVCPFGISSLSPSPCFSWTHWLLECDCLVCLVFSQSGAHTLTSHPPPSIMWCCCWPRKNMLFGGGQGEVACTRQNILCKS